jgi:TonB family protein
VCKTKRKEVKVMKFYLRQLCAGARLLALGALLLFLVCADLARAQEAPRQEGSLKIKPPMIKPPMHRSQNANNGSVKASPTRRRRVRRKRRAWSRTAAPRMTTTREIVDVPVGAGLPGNASSGGGGGGAGGSANSIKPPMANNDNRGLTHLPPGREGPVSGGVLNGKAITLPKPAYPAIARSARASGAVVVQVTIDERGDVISARAVSGHPLLQQSAVEAAREAKFTPTLLEGQPVKVTGTLTYNFVQ